MFDYYEYIRLFNSGDDDALVERFWADDCVMGGGTDEGMRGKKALRDFLSWAHDGIRELIRAQVVLQDENCVFAEIDMDFHAMRDKPDYIFGALKKGEFLTVKMFCLYFIENGKIKKLKMSSWAPNAGVSDPPVRGYGPETPIKDSVRVKLPARAPQIPPGAPGG